MNSRSVKGIFIIVILTAILAHGALAFGEPAAVTIPMIDTTDSMFVSYNTNRYMRQAPIDSARNADGGDFIPSGTPLRVTPIPGTDWAKTSYNGVVGYVKHTNYTEVPLSSVNRVELGEVYLPHAAPLMSDSGDSAKVIERIPANTLLVLIESVGQMYKVRYAEKNIVGFVSASLVMTEPKTIVEYYMLLDKSTHKLLVYQLSPTGTRTKEVIRTITSSIGKSTTPTIPGKYTLTTRERWHYFSPSYAPFVVRYANGKYTHGPLYRTRDEDEPGSLKGNTFGQDKTGGCLRIPYGDALWVYYNCAIGTTLEVVATAKTPTR